MGRRSHTRTLGIWANGRRVGQWRLPARGADELSYDEGWAASPEGRPLSLSLPIPLDPVPIRGDSVHNYFDNLLPDNDAIRRRLQSRFRTDSIDAFDLLQAIGRDCVGAVQLLPEGETPDEVLRIQARPLDEAGVARMLRNAVATPSTLGGMAMDEDELRISIAGAQEKTALLWHEGRWCLPLGATPTTHIFKLPMGLVGNRQAGMSASVENEWLCARLLAAFGLPVAACEIARFDEQKALVVERFDRRLAADRSHWLRLPQEDFCQATGTSPAAKYESDGGPGLIDISRILRNSETSDADLRLLMKAQLLFWLLAATDGHAKNFSIFLLPGGRYRLTPLYDVLSLWPITGSGAHRVDYHRLRLAMALHGRNAHYRLRDIARRHFNATARRCGLGADMEDIIAQTLARVPAALDEVGGRLPRGFPARVAETIFEGVRRQARSMEEMPSS